jgi:hypothetical protein
MAILPVRITHHNSSPHVLYAVRRYMFVCRKPLAGEAPKKQSKQSASKKGTKTR